MRTRVPLSSSVSHRIQLRTEKEYEFCHQRMLSLPSNYISLEVSAETRSDVGGFVAPSTKKKKQKRNEMKENLEEIYIFTELFWYQMEFKVIDGERICRIKSSSSSSSSHRHCFFQFQGFPANIVTELKASTVWEPGNPPETWKAVSALEIIKYWN